MEADPSPLSSSSAEELLRHTGWARRLAQSLVGDSAAAEDVVQDTWLAALRSPPDSGRPLRPWLASVVRNFARQWTRREGGLHAREREAARPDAGGPQADDLLQRFETQRLLADTLAALEEPYRTTVLLRYFEGLTAAEIARREGLPAGTVRSRLKRGLDALRGTLDERHGGDRGAWCALLVGLARGSSQVSPGPPAAPIDAAPSPTPSGWSASLTPLSGALIMQTMLKLGAVLAILVIASVGWWAATRDPRAAEPSEVDVAQAEAPSLAPLASNPIETPQAPAGVREELPVPAEPEPALEPAPEPEVAPASLEARLVDAAGAPVAGAFLRAEEAGFEARAGADGRIDAELALRHGRTLTFVAVAPGLGRARLGARCDPGRRTSLGDVVLRPGGGISGRVSDGAGLGVAGARVLVSGPDLAAEPARLRRLGPAGDLDDLERLGLQETTTDDEGLFALDGIPAGSVRVWAVEEDSRYSFTEPLEIEAGAEQRDVELVLEPLAPEDRIEGVVLDPEGEPVSVALIYVWAGPLGSGQSYIPTRDDGTFRLRLPEIAPVDFTARDPHGNDSLAWGDKTVMGVEPGELDLVIQFDEPRWIDLVVADPDGDPVERYALEIWAEDRSQATNSGLLYNAREREHAGGVLRLIAPAVAFHVRVLAPGFAEGRTWPVDPAHLPESLECELEPVPGVSGRVFVDGQPAAGVQLSLQPVWDLDRIFLYNGFRVRFASYADIQDTSDEEGRFFLTLRSAKPHVVTAELEGWAFYESATFEVDPAVGLSDLRVELGRGGAIRGRVLVDPGLDPAGTVIGFSRGDSRPRTLRAGPDGEFELTGLTPGPWQVLRVDHEIDRSRSTSSVRTLDEPQPFEWSCVVVEGETTTFDLDLGGRAACTVVGELAFDGRPAQGWSATLEREHNGAERFAEPSAAVDASGRFRLAVPDEGRYELVLTRPLDGGSVGTLRLTQKLDLTHGEHVWVHDLASGRIEGENALANGPAEVTFGVHWSRGPLRFRALFKGDERGRFELPLVPAGALEVFRYQPRRGAPADQERLRSLELAAGESEHVRLP